MGNKSSSENLPEVPVDGNSTIARAIARGTVYVIVRYPIAVEKLEGTLFNEHQFRDVLADLQQVYYLATTKLLTLNIIYS